MVLSSAILFAFLLSLLKALPSILEIKAFTIAIFSSLLIGLVLFFLPNYQKRISFFDGCILVTLVGYSVLFLDPCLIFLPYL